MLARILAAPFLYRRPLNIAFATFAILCIVFIAFAIIATFCDTMPRSQGKNAHAFLLLLLPPFRPVGCPRPSGCSAPDPHPVRHSGQKAKSNKSSKSITSTTKAIKTKQRMTKPIKRTPSGASSGSKCINSPQAPPCLQHPPRSVALLLPSSFCWITPAAAPIL